MNERTNHRDLPDNVQTLIEAVIPTTDALEVLMFLIREPGVTWTAQHIVETIHATAVSESLVQQYLTLFHATGLLAQSVQGYAYSPASPSITEAVRALSILYQQRPVTLIRAVYAIADAKHIRALAEAFRIRKERPE